MARKRRNQSEQCPNCSAALTDGAAFCPQCGQENHDLRVPFRWFVLEFIGNITSFDTKLWNTLRLIFTEPGALPKEYVEGRRARYVNPVRFYVFMSIFFFALLAQWLSRDTELSGTFTAEDTPELRRTATIGDVAGSDSLGLLLDELDMRLPIDPPYYRAARARLVDTRPSVLDSLLADQEDTLHGTRAALRHALSTLPDADSLNVPYSVFMNGILASFTSRDEEKWFQKGTMTEADVDSLLGADRDSVGWFKRRLLRSLGRIDLITPDGRKEFSRQVLSSVSIGMFLLMPFAAVLLMWFYSVKRYYWEHLILSVHLHTILFLYGGLVMVGAMLVGAKELPDALKLVLLILGVAYAVVALRKVYARSWTSTVLRLVGMCVPYVVVLTLMIVGGLLYSFISL